MAIGDQYRQISPFDRWIEDANGNIVGIQNRRGEYSRDIRFLTEDKVATTEALVSGDGTILGASKLRRMLSALGQAAYRRVDIGYHAHSIGVGVDSTSAGSYNATTFAAWHTQSQGAIVARMLSAAVGGVAGSANAVMGGTGAAPNPLFTRAGGMAAPSATDDLFGPAGWRAVFSSGAHEMAFNCVGASIRVLAIASASGLQARWFSASSGSSGAPNTVAAGASATTTPEGNRFWYEFTITGLTPGELVTLKGPTTGSYSVSYIDLDYKPSTAGVSVHRICQPGASITEINAAALDSTDTAAPRASWIGSGATAVQRRLGQAQSITERIPFDGIILQTDVNDLNEWANYSYTLADLSRHLGNLLTYYASVNLPCLVVCGPIRDPAFSVGTRPYDQAAVIAAYRNVCEGSTNGGFLDLTAEWTGGTLAARYASQVASGIMQDNVHPNQMGHGLYGQRIAQALLTAAAVRPS